MPRQYRTAATDAGRAPDARGTRSFELRVRKPQRNPRRRHRLVVVVAAPAGDAAVVADAADVKGPAVQRLEAAGRNGTGRPAPARDGVVRPPPAATPRRGRDVLEAVPRDEAPRPRRAG